MTRNHVKPSLRLMSGVEISRIIHRKETFLLLLMAIVPIGYSYALVTRSDSVYFRGSDPVSCLDWLQIMLSVVYQIVIFHMVVSLIAARSYSFEIGDHSLRLDVPRVNDRAKTFVAKMIALCVVVLAAVLVFVALSIASYYVFLVQVPTVASGALFSEQAGGTLMLVVALVLFFPFTVVLAGSLSVFFQPLPSIIAAIIALSGVIIIGQIPYLAYFSPSFYIARMTDILTRASPENAMGDMRIGLFSDQAPTVFLLYLGVTLAISGILLLVAGGRFRRRDL